MVHQQLSFCGPACPDSRHKRKDRYCRHMACAQKQLFWRSVHGATLMGGLFPRPFESVMVAAVLAFSAASCRLPSQRRHEGECSRMTKRTRERRQHTRPPDPQPISHLSHFPWATPRLRPPPALKGSPPWLPLLPARDLSGSPSSEFDKAVVGRPHPSIVRWLERLNCGPREQW